MKWPDVAKWSTLLLVASAATAVSAQQLYKYTDKDGKVTYSDRVPKPGEKAEPVDIDGKANIMPGKAAAPSPPTAGKTITPPKKGFDLSKVVERRERNRDQLKAEVDTAQRGLETAKAALENGRNPKPEEQQVVVRAGGNSVIRKPEYDDRIAALEQAVKNAEEKLAAAEAKYRRNAPD
ncbi:MAG: DUF4124 domain-containing protein [Betaproteobacteria bacterium]|nr:DUF4124 domain-containing protein [Betaproteobacteria bacterium]